MISVKLKAFQMIIQERENDSRESFSRVFLEAEKSEILRLYIGGK